MTTKKTIEETFGPGAGIVNGYLRIPKSSWLNFTATATNSAIQMLLAIVEKASSLVTATVTAAYQETIITNEKINGDNISGVYNKYLIKATGINKAQVFNPSDY